MIDRDTATIIEAVNKKLGTTHRTEPFDFRRSADLKEALTLAVAAYRDYWHYAGILLNLDERFDESLEHFDIATWVNVALAPEKTDDLAIKCACSLEETLKYFTEIEERAKEHLTSILLVVLTAPKAVQCDVLGNAYDIDPNEIDERLDDLFEAFCKTEYPYTILKSFETFLNVLNEQWAELALPK